MFKRKSFIVSQQFMKFFMPTVLMTMALSMSIVVDGMIVGNLLGPDALAAVNLVLPVTLIFNSLYVLFGAGGSILFSIALGQREKERANQLFTLSVVTMLASAVLVFLGGLFVCRPIAEALTRNAPNLTGLVYDYLRIVMMVAPLLILVPGLVYFVRATGDIKVASATLIIANVVNLALDLVYIGKLHLGISGAALATGSGYLVGLGIALYGVIKAYELKLVAIPSSEAFSLIKEIMATGVPSTINTCLNFFRLTSINAIVMLYLGSDGVTAFSVCTSCLSIVAMFVGGSAQTMGPLLGTLYGEGDMKGVRFTVHKAVTITGISTLALLAVFETFPAQITGMFGVTDARQIAIAVKALRIYAVSLPFMGIVFVTMSVYSVIGFRKLSSTIALLEGFAIVVPAAWLLAKALGPAGIWMAFVVGEVLTILTLLVLTKRIRKKQPQFKGLFLLEEDVQSKSLDVTMIQTVSQATELSAASIRFCLDNQVPEITANKVGVALEEMAVNTIKRKKNERKKSYIDVRITIDEKEVCISFRDNGAPYNPFNDKDVQGELDNIGLVLAIADEAVYDNILGMNSTIIKTKKREMKGVGK